MKKSIVVIVGLVLLGMGAFSSCKKKNNAPSAKSMITGSWKLTGTGNDDNGNGVLDASELVTDTSFLHLLITFNGNGTGASTDYGMQTGVFSWALNSDNTYLLITDTGSTTATGLYIEKLTATSMTLKDISAGSSALEVFTKQ